MHFFPQRFLSLLRNRMSVCLRKYIKCLSGKQGGWRLIIVEQIDSHTAPRQNWQQIINRVSLHKRWKCLTDGYLSYFNVQCSTTRQFLPCSKLNDNLCNMNENIFMTVVLLSQKHFSNFSNSLFLISDSMSFKSSHRAVVHQWSEVRRHEHNQKHWLHVHNEQRFVIVRRESDRVHLKGNFLLFATTFASAQGWFSHSPTFCFETIMREKS